MAKPFTPDDTCTDDIFDGAMEDMRSPQLPYLTQDLWTCDRKQEDIQAYTMETDALKVVLYILCPISYTRYLIFCPCAGDHHPAIRRQGVGHLRQGPREGAALRQPRAPGIVYILHPHPVSLHRATCI